MSGVWLGLGLALAASMALNLGYLLQHRGAGMAPPVTPRHPVATLAGLLSSGAWLAGLACGLGGWALHVAALSRAPLSLVQAFVAGGLVLCVPLAAGALGHRVARAEAAGVALMALALAGLSLGLSAPRHPGPIPSAGLAAYLVVAGMVAAALAAAPAPGARRPATLGLAGGVLYGAADLAIKALTEVGARDGLGAVARSPWLAVATLATAGAFFCFQRGLQTGRALPVIALMTAATNLVSIAGGLVVLSEPLGRTPVLVATHAGAFVLVGVAAWLLAPSQAALTTDEAARGRARSVGAEPPRRRQAPALGRGALERRPAHVALALGALRPRAAVEAEQALGPQQVDHDRDVHDQGHDLQR